MLLAGFETPTAGEILLEGKPLSRVPPYQRNIGMVFQNYALFPHMTVAANIAFPLSVRGMAAADIAERVERALDMVQLGGFGQRRPAQLSGGQQQRVAVARALVFEPKLILMDEPLGALDKQLREQMQLEIRRLHRRLGVTMVYVTHDQAEALTMSDRIAVFHSGKIQQLDTPEQMYENPKNAFVARFIGENNRLDGRLETMSTATAPSAWLPATPGSTARWSSQWKTATRSPHHCVRNECKFAQRGIQSTGIPDANWRDRCRRSSISATTCECASR